MNKRKKGMCSSKVQCTIQTDTWTKNQWTEIIWTQTYFGLGKIWTINHLENIAWGKQYEDTRIWTKTYWTKMATD